jgi:L-threonylcarbamoyladenylate synthase
VSIRIIPKAEINIPELVELIQQGHLLAIPTETVYGLAANASDEEALKKIYRLKNRPENHPLIIHIAPPRMEEDQSAFWERELSRWSSDVPPQAIALAEAFWPGPLTLILKKSRQVSDFVTGGQNTVGIRVPRHDLTIQILQAFGSGLAAPSANRFGRISPTSAQHVLEEFLNFMGDESLTILDGGQCEVGIESTILDLSRIDEVGPVILRPGMITAEDIFSVLGGEVSTNTHSEIRHSGGVLGHYAPQTLLISKETETLCTNDFMPQKIGVVTFGNFKELQDKWSSQLVDWYFLPKDADTVARSLYGLLRDLDNRGYQKIIFDQLPQDLAWSAIQDRLTRAIYGSGQH